MEMWKGKKRFLTLGAVLALLAAVFAWTIIRFTVDIPPPDTSDLTLDRPDISLEDNAFTYYSAVAKALYFPSGVFVVIDYLEGKNVDQKKLDDIIRKNKKTSK